MISFDATSKDRDLITQVVDRYMNEAAHRQNDRLSVMMDINAAHSNGCPLDFERLLAFDDFSFIHDVVGIMRHIDRETGELQDCFLPRCSKPESEAA